MKIEEYLKAESSALARCPARQLCPLAELCSASKDGMRSALFPTVIDVAPGELLWTNLRFEQRVFCIRSGVFAALSDLEHDQEVPFSLYGCGQGVGFGELYLDQDVSDSYYLRALCAGQVCSMPAKAVRRCLGGLPPTYVNTLLSSVLTNVSAAAFTQARITARPLVGERVVMLLLSMADLYAREGRKLEELHLTHGELAALVASDRVSITRALHKLEADGLVELGYRSIRALPALFDLTSLTEKAATTFHTHR